MASHAYLFQLLGQVFRENAQQWLDTWHPVFQDTPRHAIDHCPGCFASVLRHVEGISTEAAVNRTRSHLAGV